MKDEPKRTPALLGLLAGMALLAGCSTSKPGEVQELEAGTYSISVNRSSTYLAETDKAIAAAVNKAGEHCHAKGEKFMLKSAVGKTVVFRCVPMTPGAAPEPAPQVSQGPQALHPPPPQ